MNMTTRTGYVFDELYMWHDPGNLPGGEYTEPTEHWENSFSKRRFHNLLAVSGLLEKLVPIKARAANKGEITRFHTNQYHDKIVDMSKDRGGNAGDHAWFSKGGYEIACLSAGGVIAAVEALVAGKIDNAYCLVRPPGHHAERDRGMGFCIFNNIAIAALHARTLTLPQEESSENKQSNAKKKIQRIAIIDYDVHHGNGTQQAFWDDKDTLFISLHQDNNYPQGTGSVEEIGGDTAKGTTINVPLPPGTGTGGYEYAWNRVVLPAVDRFNPDIILVSSGFDGSYQDPLARMMLTSDSYSKFTKSLMELADKHCNGRIIFAHEGGYSKDYVPFCGLAVVETLRGIKTSINDHYLVEARLWGYQHCQPHQAALVDRVVSLLNLSPMPSYQDSDDDQDDAFIQGNPIQLTDDERKVIELAKSTLNIIISQIDSTKKRKAAWAAVAAAGAAGDKTTQQNNDG